MNHQVSSPRILAAPPSYRRLCQSADSTETSTASSKNLLSSRTLIDGSDDVLKLQDAASEISSGTDQGALNRRLFMGATLVATSAALSQGGQAAFAMEEKFGKLGWESTPVNKRTGVTVFDAEKSGYNVRFVTYLARVLLVFDIDCQKWWYSRAADIPRRATAQEVEEIRLKQFGAFSASVEVGLQEYRGSDGPAKLMESLLIRYCPTIETVREKRSKRGLPPLSEDQEIKERREIKEARRQIALLFGIMEYNQPVDALNKLLAAIDNGSIAFVKVKDGGSGYAPGYGSPNVEFPTPNAGKDFKTATGRATLQPNGRILSIDLNNRGFGYQKAPTVTISSPGDDRGVFIPGARAAKGKAFIFKNGVNKGRLDRIQLEDDGEGYLEGENIRCVLSSPELPGDQGGVTATAQAIMEYEVASIEIIDGGSGYAVEKPIAVFVEPPPLTARVNMNDPRTARIIDPSKPIPQNRMSPEQLQKLMPDPKDPNSFSAIAAKMANNNGVGGGGGCIGRACYDRPVVAYATAQAEISSFSTFRTESDARIPIEREEEVLKENRIISATLSGSDSQLPSFWNGPPSSSSAQLLTLLPAGFGLEYDDKLNRFELSAGQDFIVINKEVALGGSNRPLDPDFGPRGRSPIERDLKLNLPNFLRFCLSGAVCASGVHLVRRTLCRCGLLHSETTVFSMFPCFFFHYKRL